MKSQMEQDNERWLKYMPKDTKWIVNMCDTFDHSHYPIYCKTEEELKKAQAKRNKNMQQVYSVINVKQKKC
jgi:hypothetical protein